MPDRRTLLAGLLATAALPHAAQAKKLPNALRAIVPFEHSPFPYRGPLPDGSGPFLDVVSGRRRGHTSPRGGVYWEDETYSDRGTLLALPKGFHPEKPAAILVFFHGNGATLQRDVVVRQRVVAQMEASKANVALVAPQFAVDALDSSAGSFWQPGVFGRFMEEAARQLSSLSGIAARHFSSVPIVLCAYSGGYNPAAYVLRNGDVGARLSGVILLDAIFGEEEKFARWIDGHSAKAFFVSAYGRSSREGNLRVLQLLAGSGIHIDAGAPRRLAPGTVAFIDSDAPHDSYVTKAFVGNPLQWLLARIPGLER